MTENAPLIPDRIRNILLGVLEPGRPPRLTVTRTKDPAGVNIVSEDPQHPSHVTPTAVWVSADLWRHMVTGMLASVCPGGETPHDQPASGAKGAPCAPIGGQPGTEVEEGGASKSQSPECQEPATGGTFAQSPVEGGGSTGNSHGASRTMENTGSERAKRGERAVDENHGAEDSMVSERVKGLAPAGDGSVYGARLGGGWWQIRSKGCPGAGMYRFSFDELPDGNLIMHPTGATSIDLFGADIHAARALLAKFCHQTPEKFDGVYPVAHRPTRLCRAARRARGEI